MTIAPLPRERAARLTTSLSQRTTDRKLIRRRWGVAWMKRLLPLGALLLLSSVALWPQIARQFDAARISFQSGGLSGELQTGKLLNVRYHGVDARNRPYTVTAEQADQVSPERINLVAPKGDVVSESGSWTYSQSRVGVYMQHTGIMDMSGDVVLYRDSGITMNTSSATMDLKTGAASSDQPTHVEGPFGTLDAQGFALVDKGNVIQFDGKSRLWLNGSHK